MSDQPQGAGWWQATDGQWYPPDQTPGGGAAASSGGAGGQGGVTAKGFFSALYDPSFETFVTPKLLRIFYVIALLILTVGAVFFLIGALATGEGANIVAALILVPIGYLVYVIVTRVYFELVAALFRIADDLQAIRRGKGA